ncbi:MAG: helix-turn-helix transcriptional regulator [Christiangramia sp.]|uniref:AraC family transcriptional regulator n=1 Tax=Christiangramia sp. TaxID=1931228 RepID=UPI003241DC98
MQHYYLELKEVDDFIPALAEHFGIGYKNELGEYALHVPKDLGKGKLNCINFPNGIGLYWFDCTFLRDTKIQIFHPNVTPLRLIYCVNGELSSHFNNQAETFTIKGHEHLIAAPRADEVHSLIFKANTKVDICYLEIDRKKFKHYLSFDIEELEPIYYKIFSDIQATNQVCDKGSYGFRTFDVIKQIKNCEEIKFPRINFMGAKSLEILSYMLTRFSKNQDQEQYKYLKRKDLKAIENAVEYISNNLSTVGTVDEIAKEVNLNVNKLQEGFQAIYGQTVNSYIRDVRLTKALNLLSTGEKNVSEVVYELGLSSRSYFSKIFKKKYGISPSRIISNQANYVEHIENKTDKV